MNVRIIARRRGAEGLSKKEKVTWMGQQCGDCAGRGVNANGINTIRTKKRKIFTNGNGIN